MPLGNSVKARSSEAVSGTKLALMSGHNEEFPGKNGNPDYLKQT